MQLTSLFRKKPKPPTNTVELPTQLTLENLEALIAELKKREQPPVDGDGKAVFIADMTDAEYIKWKHEEEDGWRAVYNKMLGRDTPDDER